jgi:outer membrane protein assembly factor BamB
MGGRCFLRNVWAGTWLLLAVSWIGEAAAQQIDRNDLFQQTELSETVYVDEIDGAAKSQLQRFEEFLATAQWQDAALLLSRLVDDSSATARKLISTSPTEASFARYVPWRRYLLQRAAALPPEAREAWMTARQSTHQLAGRWYEEAIATQDEQLLQKIVDQAYTSPVADNSLLALGEMALQKGHADAARRDWEQIHSMFRWQFRDRGLPLWFAVQGIPVEQVWEQISPGLNDGAKGAYPDSEIPPARVWADQIVAAILSGDTRRAIWELELLRRIAPEARGNLAGREVVLVDGLAGLLAESRGWPEAVASRDWSTWGGSPSRTTQLADEIDIGPSPDWSVKLPVISQPDRTILERYGYPHRAIGEELSAPYCFHPLIVGELVVLASANSIRCLKLDSGKPAWEDGQQGVILALKPDREAGSFSSSVDPENVAGVDLQGMAGVIRPTLTAHRNLLVACIGDGVSRNRQLVGLNLAAQGAIEFGPLSPESSGWFFQGSPVTDGISCWVGMRQMETTARDHVACFDVGTGKMRWRTPVGASDTMTHGELLEAPNQLLTWHEDTIYCSTNLGVIGAIDADSGDVRWVTRYPREGARQEHPLDEPYHLWRDLSPCIVDHGRLIAAPADTRSVLALDAGSGELLWKTDVCSDVVQLLGVSEQYLLASGQRLWWIDLLTGRPADFAANPFPAARHSVPVAAGRGLLGKDRVYWPARGEEAEIHILDLAGGQPVRSPLRLTAAESGNLVYGHGFLLIAASDRLYAFRNRAVLGSPVRAPAP